MPPKKPIMANKQELLDIEKGFWTGDSAYYEANADTGCLVAFPQMAKAMTNAELAATASKPNRWRDLDIKLKGMVEPGSDIIMLTYEAHATRENGESYAALVSTGYVHRADGWKMMFHAQTPLDTAQD
ncbi:hypothetical protein EN828_29720 [Mesorhizobium sp. M2D.F.Ca.ET.185.01.1.1]|uniref:hypothetical protein n=1 Tax=unclassified Mesorhizobium TaxID=325217 RepID=UPI000FCCABA6|nr:MULTISPECIES: hypothetical protein [unclassified Mesorhizobium]TGP52431.1 hypothetical protein EN873_14165 [bacterium M00.F.Ca.ET.230.01.1.1]TGP73729.1 hypothetical protein EN870_29370 [bacterium M00.F.Ca.ET.227.01.1.1]TGP86453.1 hypothetical protein EN864_24490 [bacterium M00.F.Ca.ET.221.01.1.1]TGP86664.1 hypothetical protein EN865_31245 [bacterium M00.F.Ca.ET.222.01.1.1]TGT73041.1 hypothetical protein EN802_14365 [bacterium M00.F.Ca.ET.159.01.1.1]TGT84296.1 hypothetical protein EN800_151